MDPGNSVTPFLFNELKHHFYAQLQFIRQARAKKLSPQQISDDMLKIGNSMIDLYFGTLSVADICLEIGDLLKSENHYKKECYHKYLNSVTKKYRKIQISDRSSWTLLVGREEGRYIHIHPSRASIYTIRVRAIAVKTALMIMIFYDIDKVKGELVKIVNDIRTNYLGESPIKNESYTIGLKRILNIYVNY